LKNYSYFILLLDGVMVLNRPHNLPVFEAWLINLPHREDRLLRAIGGCEKAGVNARVHTALDGQMAREVLPESCLKGGELGLIGSIITALESISKETEFDWVLVIEDDVKFTRDLRALRKELLALPEEVTAVRAGYLPALLRRYSDIPSIRSWKDLPHALQAMVSLRSRAEYLRARVTSEYAEWRRLMPEGSIRNLQWGTHLWAVRPRHAMLMIRDLMRVDAAADHAFIQLIREEPSRYRNLRTSFATQFASSSDIQNRRYRTE
jgi:hypothetical protein